jgi:acyl-CoA thioester hydrolase
MGQHGRVSEQLPAPLDVHRDVVRPEWIDFNGHMNAGYYMVAFDDAISPWSRFYGMTDEHRAAHRVTTFSAENHITYERELREGTRIGVSTQLLAYDRKRIHAMQLMHDLDQGVLAATNEVMSLHVSEDTRRVSEMHDDVYARLGEVWDAHRHLDVPPQVGRVMRVKDWSYT